MKKTLICGLPMREITEENKYISEDKSIVASERAVKYPLNAFIESSLDPEDEVKVILLGKKDAYSQYKHNAALFMEELMAVNDTIGASINYKVIETNFEETQSVHEQLLVDIVNEISIGSHVIADITYGPKDLPLVVFSALNFAEKSLNCEVDNIIYGQANFDNNRVVNTRICDMIPLYCLNSITNTIKCDTPEKAKQVLVSLLSI